MGVYLLKSNGLVRGGGGGAGVGVGWMAEKKKRTFTVVLPV